MNRIGRELVRRWAVVVATASTLLLTGCGGGGLGDLFAGGAPKPATAAPPGSTVVDTSPTSGPSKPTGKSSIAVLVNEDPVTLYDIQQRVKLMRLGGAQASEKTATDELVDETLMLYEGRKRGVNVPQQQVDSAFASIGENMKLNPAQLTQALASQGIDAATLKRRLRSQITWQYLVQRHTQLTAKVKSTDIMNALLAKGDPNQLTITEFKLQQIIFIVPKDSPPAAYTQRRREAEAFRQRFQGCDKSLAQAKDLRAVVVKDLGRRDSTQLSGPAGDAIKKTPPGKTAPPSQFDEGIEVVAVCATRDVQSSAAARAEITNDFYLKQSKDLGKDYLAELRKGSIIEYR
ncbi:peptidylprolyl isomerase [soil metagenome]